jgi:selenocysteine lyase/cysteine desulfurase
LIEPRLGDRSAFPELKVRAYLSHAAISPPSTMVRAAVRDVLDAYAADGALAFGRFVDQRARLRDMIASLIGASGPGDIAFVPNTTRGVTDIALCLPWQEGDRIVVSDGEFPANVTPWQRAAALFRLEVVMLPRPSPSDVLGAWFEKLAAALAHPRTRMFAVSAVQFQTGLSMPLERIGALCRSNDVQLFVDGIQGCGLVPIDVTRCQVDYLSCGGHKWLMGLEGVGFLYVAPERAKVLLPHVAGWLSHEDALSFLFEGSGRLRYDRPIVARAGMVEGGISNSVGCAALEAAIAALQHIGVPRIAAHVNGYLDALESKLCARGFGSLRATDPALRSGIGSFTAPAGVDVVRLHRHIDGSVVSCTNPDGYLRFAPHWPNALEEVAPVVDAVDEALRQVSSSDSSGW